MEKKERRSWYLKKDNLQIFTFKECFKTIIIPWDCFCHLDLKQTFYV